MIMQTENGMKRIESNPPKRKAKKSQGSKVKANPLSKIKVQLLDFSGINSELDIQFSNGNKHIVAPNVVGQVKAGQKVILITDECEMICQYAYKLGYELPVFIEGDDEPVMIASFERKDLTRSKTGKTVPLSAVLGDNLKKRGVLLRAEQLLRRVEESNYTQQTFWD